MAGAGAPPASTGQGAADELGQAAAPPLPPATAEGGELSDSDRRELLVGLAKSVREFGEEFAEFAENSKQLAEQFAENSKQLAEQCAENSKQLAEQCAENSKQLAAVAKQLAAVARDTDANSKSLACMSGAIITLPGYWPGRSVTNVDDMLSMVSCNGWRAKQEDVMAKLLADHCGYCALEEQLLRKLGARAPEVGILISQFEGGDGWRWDKKLRFLHKVEVAARKSQQPQQPDDAGEDRLWWRAYMSALQEYCAVADAAGKHPDGGSRPMGDFLLRPLQAACPPLLMMVVALATGQLRTSIEFDGEPRLAVHDGVASMEIMGIKNSLKGLPTAQKQLEVAGRTVVWLLHAANQELLAANQLDLRGVMTVQGWLTAEERKVWKREVDVSCPGLKATMRLDMVSY